MIRFRDVLATIRFFIDGLRIPNFILPLRLPQLGSTLWLGDDTWNKKALRRTLPPADSAAKCLAK
jgi:hypothetical protein